MRFLTLALCAVLFSSVAAFAQGFTKADPPSWIDITPLPEIDPGLLALAQGGVYYVLGDRQIRWQGEVEDDYYRNVMKIIDRAGLDEAATVQLNYNPAFEEAILTRLQILRGDQVIDLRDSLSFETYRRETRLNEGIIDGTLTTVLQIPDLRVGDILDTAWILRGKPAVPGAPIADTGRLEFSEPVGLERLQVHWPKDKPIYLTPLPAKTGVTYSTRPGGADEVIHEWRAENLIPVEIEDDTPISVDIRALVRFSSDKDWGGLSGAISPFYLADYPLPPEWVARLDAIRAQEPTDAARATAALRMVQDDLRYVSLSVGAGGYYARLPEVVIVSGFGDCKDKALLLRVMLKALGIEAYVALANLDYGYGLPLQQPSLGAFDHAIVKARIGGKTIWMDPTATHQGGQVDTEPAPDYGFALPLSGPEQTALEPMLIDPATYWQVDVEESYDFRFTGVFLKVRSTYRGEAANDRRRTFAVTPIATKSADFLEFYTNRYPGIQLLQPLKLEDDRTSNTVTLHESYFLPKPALFRNGLREDFVFAAENFADNLPDTDTGDRKAPLATGAASAHHHKVIVTDAPISFDPPDNRQISNGAFDFGFTATADDSGGMTLDWTYMRKGPTIPVDQVAGVIRDAQEVGEQVWWSWNLIP